MSEKRIVVVGGVAAGASAAAKARRTSEDVEITLLEAGPYMSFANCGLPYYLGGEIAERDSLFVADAELFARRFRVDVRLNTRATRIDRPSRSLTVESADGATEELGYDRLILATGTVALRPPIEGLEAENIFTVRTVPDVDAISSLLEKVRSGEPAAVAAEQAAEAPLRAVVIGGGYIGLETAEQLRRRGLDVTLIELMDQVMPGALDAEIAQPLAEAIESEGVRLVLGDGVSRIEHGEEGSVAVTQSGREFPFELGIQAVGVKPNVELAADAEIELGETGAIRVDAWQRTMDPTIYAAGDNCEYRHLVLDEPVHMPLAGPANKAGRVAGANAALDLAGAGGEDGRRLKFLGVLGTAVVRAGRKVAAVTGVTEAVAKRRGMEHRVTLIPGASHAGYYPGAESMLLKVLWASATGRLLGAQAVGGEGVDKRIDVLATAITAGMCVDDLEQLDLCYAPPFGSAKDPVVMAGFAAANERRGVMPSMTPGELLDELAGGDPPLVVDVRSSREHQAGRLPESFNVPVDELRDRLDDLPSDRPIAMYCGVGYRSYIAQQILRNLGRENVRNVLGGYLTIQQTRKARQRSGE